MARGKKSGLMACAGAAVCLLVLAAGCGSSGDEKHPEPKASAGKDDGEKKRAAAERDALAAYRGMWDAQVEAYSSGSMKNAKLGDYTTGDAAAMIIESFTYYNANDLAFKGRPDTSPKVSAVDVASSVHTATIDDCVDMTGVLIRRSSGKPIARAKEGDRHPWTARATTAKDGKGGWRITDYTIDRDRPC
ncbi:MULTISPECIES: hypothetical protein [Streptomyces]|uniref:Lipoprotein n=1 Tax=Streptomyces drozdowiczii TaxID=202862 RepID=A0ABY6PTW3_9ACTN|nr:MULTISPECIES: hypothetical protein [Streptomyces]MCX0244604.1 hypothetical protein [Streptomyces drozdowiczii]OKJ73801.1 hypothetical protein AMK30_14790 [Streptomyces sp. CB02460]UZK55648.1 hypothetical protein NEH16_17310 [Streptomyces drozdowiczii]